MVAKRIASRKKPEIDLCPKFIEAGIRLLALGIPSTRLNSKNVAAEAGLKPAKFNAAFPVFEDFLLGLLKQLSNEVRAESVKAIAQKPPGNDLIRDGITAYLDIVLNRPALLEITMALRAHPVCQQITRARMSSLVSLATLQLKMKGMEHAEGVGQLGMAMLFEITHAEFEARRALPDYRTTINSYFAVD